MTRGSIKFEGTELSTLLVNEIPPLGLLRTFQQTKIYGQMTCMMNMKISKKTSNNYFSMFEKIPKELDEEAEQILSFVGLYEKRHLRAGELSFGQQKLLELAMALMNEPKMLMLDEPTAGINPTLINGIIDRLIKINDKYKITLFVIEHNMRVVMNLVQHVYCMAHGKLLADGKPEEIKNNKKVIDAYLGAH